MVHPGALSGSEALARPLLNFLRQFRDVRAIWYCWALSHPSCSLGHSFCPSSHSFPLSPCAWAGARSTLGTAFWRGRGVDRRDCTSGARGFRWRISNELEAKDSEWRVPTTVSYENPVKRRHCCDYGTSAIRTYHPEVNDFHFASLGSASAIHLSKGYQNTVVH